MTDRLALVHIGVEKTGTTYLQQLLASNVTVLADAGLAYPSFLGSANHHALAAYACDAAPPQDVHRWNDVDRAGQVAFRASFADRLRTEVARSDATRWVFSCEHLSSRLDDAAAERLVELFEHAGLKTRVVVYLRPQEDMIESTFATAIVAGSPEPFDVATAIAASARYDFASLLGRWERAVGRDALDVRRYPRGRPSADLGTDFATSLGVDPRGLEVPAERANRSLPFVQAELLRLLNAAARDVPDAEAPRRKRLQDLLVRLPGAPFALETEERAQIRTAFAAGNEVVLERYGVDLTPRDGHGTSPRPEGFTLPDVHAFLTAVTEVETVERRRQEAREEARRERRRVGRGKRRLRRSAGTPPDEAGTARRSGSGGTTAPPP